MGRPVKYSYIFLMSALCASWASFEHQPVLVTQRAETVDDVGGHVIALHGRRRYAVARRLLRNLCPGCGGSNFIVYGYNEMGSAARTRSGT